MATAVDMDDIVQKLRALKSTEFVSLIDNDGGRHKVSKAALQKCPFFENRFNAAPDQREIKVQATTGSIEVFKRFLNGYAPEKQIEDAFDVMAFACRIQDERLLQYCAHAASGIVVPDDASVQIKSTIIRALVKFLPRRTFKHYKALLTDFAHGDEGQMDTLIDEVISVLSSEMTYENKPLALPLLKTMSTVVLMESLNGEKLVAILADYAWVPCDVFGPNFCPFKAGVNKFHLSFGRYVVYERLDGSVFKKDLRSDEPAKCLFTNCKFFRSRCNELHMIIRDETRQGDALYEWDHQTESFVQKLCLPTLLMKTVHCDDQDRLTLVLDDGGLLNINDDDYTYTEGGDEKIDDRVGDWTLAHGEDQYVLNTAVSSANKTPINIGRSAHIGHNIIGTARTPFGAYETRIIEKEDGGEYESYTVGVHGKVISFSDVLIL